MSTKIKNEYENLLRNESVKSDTHIEEAHNATVEYFGAKSFKDINESQMREFLSVLFMKLNSLYTQNKVGLQDLPRDVVMFLKFLQQNKGSDDPVTCPTPLGNLKVSFDTVAGQNTAKEDLRMGYIYPLIFSNLFLAKSNGILLYGPPGTGKTMLAKAATKELNNVAFFNPLPSEMKGKYEGDTEKNISKIFKCAADYVENGRSKLSVIFIDEFESLGGVRSTDPSMGRSVNTLLQMMDGINKLEGVSVIAATNLPWNLDRAILRRFSGRIFIDLPDITARMWLFVSAVFNNYSSPTIPMNDRSLNLVKMTDEIVDKENTHEGLNYDDLGNKISWNESPAIDLIQKYGKSLCEGDDNQLVDIVLLHDFAEKTGPNKNGEEIINKIKGGEMVNPNDYKGEGGKDVKFGYSASDIIKVMDIAIRNASNRARHNDFFIKTKLEDGEYYIATAREEGGGKLYSIGKRPGTTVINPKDYDKILNFTLCKEDIEEALGLYPSTIVPDEYIQLLNYKYLNIIPE
jgi:SpoVK/Ycf46/Vps4 family AAA+-type ATPase